MNILIIVRALTGGGAERVAASWANDLSRTGNNVFVMADFVNYPITYSLDDNIIRINSTYSKNKIKREIFSPWEKLCLYRKTIKDIIPDVIICVMNVRSVMLKLSITGLKNKPFLILTDHSALERPKTAPMKLWTKMRKFYYSRVFDLITVLTKRDASILRNRGFKNVEVMHNPLFLKSIKEIPEKEKIVLAVGRLNDWYYKGFDLLIKAWNEICKEYPSWKLKIVGSGSDKNLNLLKNFVSDESSVEFIDYTSDIKSEYSSAAIFVLSSRYEGWGLVLVEAMSQGCAPIACDYLGRQAEIINDNENGILIQPDSIENIKNALSKLIIDPELRKNIQEKATRSVERFYERKVTERWMQIFKKYNISGTFKNTTNC